MMLFFKLILILISPVGIGCRRITWTPGAMGKNLFHLIDIDFVNGSIDELKQHLTQKGFGVVK